MGGLYKDRANGAMQTQLGNLGEEHTNARAKQHSTSGSVI